MDNSRLTLIVLTWASLAVSIQAAELTTPYQRGLEAARLYNSKQWEPAAQVYAQVVAENPDLGNRWREYANVLYQLKRYDESTAAYRHALDLGAAVPTCTYNIACNYALLGKTEDALLWLRKALNMGFLDEQTLRTDTDFESLRSDPRFREVVGMYPPEGLSRDDRWRFDLDYLLRRGERIHYDLYGRVSRIELQVEFEDLKTRVGALEDHEIVAGIMKILGMLGDGHSVVLGYEDGRPALRAFPIDMYLFSDGFYVRGAREEYRSIVGGKVLRVGRLSAEEALRAVRPYCSVDNGMGVKSWSAYLLKVPEVLHAQRIIEDPLQAAYVIETATGETVTVQLAAEDAPHMHAGPFRSDFVYAHQLAGGTPPLYLRNLDEAHWFEHLPGRKMVFAAYNVVGPDGDETVAQFAERLFAFINANAVDYLVLDLRHNGGGNNTLNRPLVHGVVRCDRINRKGHFFVITGRRTFSAAMNAAVELERNTEAIFVGEPTGSSPNFVGEVSPTTLPCSGLRVSLSSLYWQGSLPNDHRTWIAPSIPAPLSVRDFRDNRDPAMEAIFAEVASKLDPPTTGMPATQSAPN